MVKLQNNFLKLYEEMNHLWESSDIPPTASTSNIKHDFSFSTIVQKALNNADEESLSSEDIAYWCDLRNILLNKYVRLGDTAAST